MKKLEKKLEVLMKIRAKYNTSLFSIKSDKRTLLVQKWANEINKKILEVEKQLLEVRQ